MFWHVEYLRTANFDYTLCTHILLLLLLTFTCSGETRYQVTDSSKSQYCKHGLLAGKDIVDMEIKTNLEGEDITTVGFQAVDPLDNFTIQFCSINLNLDCSTPASEGCICKSVEGKMYTLKYVSSANSMYSGNMLRINGEYSGVNFQTIQKDEPVVVYLKVNGAEVKRGTGPCEVSLTARTIASFMVCAEGVTSPVLNLTYAGQVKISRGENCLEAGFCTESQTKPVYYSVVNSCHQNTFYSCTIRVIAAPGSSKQVTKSTTASTTEEPHETDSNNMIKFIIAIIVMLILTVLAVQLYKVNLTDSPRASSGADGADVGVSTPVDVLPKASSISSIRRLTQRFSFRSVSHQKMTPMVDVLDAGTEV